MRCAWQAYLKLVPPRIRDAVDGIGRGKLQELRLRMGRPPEMILFDGVHILDRLVTSEDLNYCVNAASQYSPWSSATSTSGFITAAGGHRIGICGDMAVIGGRIHSVRCITSVSVRVACDFPGIGTAASGIVDSILIVGSPGRGKTTLLRDLIRQKSNDYGETVAVVDERRELFPFAGEEFCFPPGMRTEILSGCSKPEGIEMLIRTMSPGWLAVDEITAESDCRALIHAGWCGVRLLATAHAENMQDFVNRPVYRALIDSRLFSYFIIMEPDKSWTLERMNI